MTPPLPPKQRGCCVMCGAEVYQVIQRDDAGHPARLGPMLDSGCQIELMMSDGSEASIACCLDCARQITPADYQRIWDACGEAAVRPHGDRPLRRAHILRDHQRVWPIAFVRRRREGPGPGGLIVDRR